MEQCLKKRKKRKRFSLIRSEREIAELIDGLPTDDCVYKFISDGGFSSISFVKYISGRCHIRDFYASSFRIGKKELRLIDRLFKSGVIDMCHFAVGTLMANDSEPVKRYKYYEDFKSLCDTNGWTYSVVNNHSKIMLFDTDVGKFVIETSSNLNENHKIEQFGFEKDEELFEFYKQVFENWKLEES